MRTEGWFAGFAAAAIVGLVGLLILGLGHGASRGAASSTPETTYRVRVWSAGNAAPVIDLNHCKSSGTELGAATITFTDRDGLTRRVAANGGVIEVTEEAQR